MTTTTYNLDGSIASTAVRRDVIIRGTNKISLAYDVAGRLDHVKHARWS
jgi:hypothetical protein